jgi:UDP-glucose 4-epimerase
MPGFCAMIWSMARGIVTGGAGFIGSHLADALLERGDEVLVVDDLSAGRRELVPERATFEPVDIVDAEALRRAFDGFEPDLVFHLAAQASVTVSMERPQHDCSVNVLGTLNVCDSSRRHRAPVVFASTGGALYGDEAPLPTPEHFAASPMAPYGASKQAGEAYVTAWGRIHGTANVVLRLGNVYGPRQNPHGEAGVVAIFSEKLLAGEAPPLRGRGAPTQDYVHVTDVVRAFLLAVDDGRAGIYNVGTGVQTSTAQVLELLQDAAGTRLEPLDEPLREGELHASALDSSRIERDLGWRPTISIADGLRDTFEWYAAQRA